MLRLIPLDDSNRLVYINLCNYKLVVEPQRIEAVTTLVKKEHYTENIVDGFS